MLVVTTLREQAAQALRQEIIMGRLPPGAELSQDEVAARLGVSRMPVREAFQMLERDGLVELRPHRRARVRALSLDDVRDHYEVRALIEGEAAARAALHADLVDDIAAAIEDTETLDDPHAYSAAAVGVHHAIWSAADSPRLKQMAGGLFRGLPLAVAGVLPNLMERSRREHREILDAIRSGSPEAARGAMTRHVLRTLDELLARHRA